MPGMTTLKGERWDDALVDQRLISADDEGVWLLHGADETVDARLYFGVNEGAETECSLWIGRPKEPILTKQSEVEIVLRLMGLPEEGWF